MTTETPSPHTQGLATIQPEHTPKPWCACGTHIYGYRDHPDTGETTAVKVADMCTMHDRFSYQPDDIEANISLATTAPDLLETCQYVLRYIEAGGSDLEDYREDMRSALRIAIAKATDLDGKFREESP